MATQQTLSGNVKSDISVTATHAYDLVTGTWPLRNTQTATISSAATSVTCDLIYQDSHSLAAGASYDYDLNAPLTDYTGATMAFDRVHFVYVRNTTTGAAAGESIINVGADAAPFPWFFGTPATDTVNINPGGWISSYCGPPNVIPPCVMLVSIKSCMIFGSSRITCAFDLYAIVTSFRNFCR